MIEDILDIASIASYMHDCATYMCHYGEKFWGLKISRFWDFNNYSYNFNVKSKTSNTSTHTHTHTHTHSLN